MKKLLSPYQVKVNMANDLPAQTHRPPYTPTTYHHTKHVSTMASQQPILAESAAGNIEASMPSLRPEHEDIQQLEKELADLTADTNEREAKLNELDEVHEAEIMANLTKIGQALSDKAPGAIIAKARRQILIMSQIARDWEVRSANWAERCVQMDRRAMAYRQQLIDSGITPVDVPPLQQSHEMPGPMHELLNELHVSTNETATASATASSSAAAQPTTAPVVVPDNLSDTEMA